MAQPDLTTLEACKTFIGLEATDLEMDAQIDVLIKAASNKIRERLDRKFTSPVVTETREHYVREYQDRVYLDEVLLTLMITSVVTPEGVAIPYMVRPDHRAVVKGMWLHIVEGTLPRSAYPADHAELFITEWRGTEPVFSVPGKIMVTATYGWSSIPPDIELAARMAVKYWHETEIAHFGRTVDIAQGIVVTPEALPSTVTNMIREWKMPDVGVLSGSF